MTKLCFPGPPEPRPRKPFLSRAARTEAISPPQSVGGSVSNGALWTDPTRRLAEAENRRAREAKLRQADTATLEL